jgi:ATPase subunit of ABC transporter with duplicated ATPase domains
VSVRGGTIALSQSLSVGYLEQTAVTGSSRTVRDEVMSRMDRLVSAQAALDVASQRVSDGDVSDGAIDALAEAEAAFGAAGGYDSDKLVANVLRGLGFSEADQQRPCAEFSGGWRMRIALARLLLSAPELLLLDEPSNHLDSSAKRWLGDYLAKYEGTLLLVSHDEEIIGAAVTSIAEVDSETRTIESFKSMGLAQWREEREARKVGAALLLPAAALWPRAQWPRAQRLTVAACLPGWVAH